MTMIQPGDRSSLTFRIVRKTARAELCWRHRDRAAYREPGTPRPSRPHRSARRFRTARAWFRMSFFHQRRPVNDQVERLRALLHGLEDQKALAFPTRFVSRSGRAEHSEREQFLWH